MWAQQAPDLERKGVLTDWDTEALALYCDATVRHRRASKHLDDEGEVVELPVFNKNGDLTGHRLGKNPWQLIWKETAEVMLRYGSRFGLTPSDRSQLSIGEARRGPSEDLLTG